MGRDHLIGLVVKVSCLRMSDMGRDRLSDPQAKVSCLRMSDMGIDQLVGLVVKVSDTRVADLEFDSHLCHGDFSGPSHTSDLKIGTPVATLPGAWRYRVCARTGVLGVSTLTG